MSSNNYTGCSKLISRFVNLWVDTTSQQTSSCLVYWSTTSNGLQHGNGDQGQSQGSGIEHLGKEKRERGTEGLKAEGIVVITGNR